MLDLDIICESQVDTELCVLESMCQSYDKALLIMENFEDVDNTDSFFQEDSHSRSSDKNDKSEKLSISILKAIQRFFIMIGEAISKAFSKVKEDVLKRLGKVDKLEKKKADSAQEELDDINGYAYKKSKVLKDKHAKYGDENVKEFMSNKKKNKNDLIHTSIDVRNKCIYTRINFENWKEFLSEANDYVQLVSGDLQQLGSDLRSATTNTVTRQIKLKSLMELREHRSKGPLGNLISDIRAGSAVRDTRHDKYALFNRFSHKHSISELMKDVNDTRGLFFEVSTKSKTAADKFGKTIEYFDEYMKNSYSKNKYPLDIKTKILYKDIRVIHKELTTIHSIVTKLTIYMSRELNLYGDLLDIIEPIIDEKHIREEKE